MRIFRRCLDWKAERRFAARLSAFFSSSVRGPLDVEVFELDDPLALDADVALPLVRDGSSRDAFDAVRFLCGPRLV